HLAGTLQLLMQLNQAPYRVVVEARSALEPVISSLAAERMDAESRAELAASITQMRENIDDMDWFREASKRFHGVIAWSSGNVLYAYIVDALLGILDGTAIGTDDFGDRRAAILRAHEEIYAAISRHDADAAGARMREHIDSYARYAQRRFPDMLEQTVTWDRLLA
ncbi:MAG TPA: FCD domain-containing protein, partial [Streptosporangiaceae bacterium]|nr:FCD domain-containing protein [Streptosporangiaceae bacterium]